MESMKILNNRTKSSFNISIGTAFALESIFDPTGERYDQDKIINKVDVRNYKIHYINLTTLIRNMLSSLPTSIQKEMVISHNAVESVIRILQEELSIISMLYNTINIKPIVYIADYKKVSKTLTTYLDKELLNGHRYNIANLEDKVIDYIHKKKPDFEVDVIGITHKLPATTEPTLITTHIALDLLNIKSIPKLKLLESHTGLIKDKYSWHSKYHPIGKRDLSIFPFNERLMYILGDRGSNKIKPLNIKIRTGIHELATADKWTPYTTDSKIKNSLSKDTDLLFYYNSFQYIY